MKLIYFYIISFCFCNFILSQEIYKNKNVEGVILRPETIKNNSIIGLFANDDLYLISKKEDIDCFEEILKKVINGFYSNFYRQYYAKKVENKKLLYVTLIAKNSVQFKELRQELYYELDACENIRYLTFDIENEKIITNTNGGGCDY